MAAEMSSEDLIQAGLAAVKRERESQMNLAVHLLEIDRRKLWWKMGYSSLYNYCEQRFKLDPAQVDEILELVISNQ